MTYFSIQFQGVNEQNFGDYPDGFTPANTVATQGVVVPGCSVADDFAHALGNPAESQLASALSYRTDGVCPLPPSMRAASVDIAGHVDQAVLAAEPDLPAAHVAVSNPG